MSKARQLANLLSNNRDLSDGASTGSEITFTAHGAIEDKKPVIFNADGTVSEAGQSQAIAGEFLTSITVDSAVDSSYPWDFNYAHDIATVGDYAVVVGRNTDDGNVHDSYCKIYKYDSASDELVQKYYNSVILNNTYGSQRDLYVSVTYITTNGDNAYFLIFGGKEPTDSNGYYLVGQVLVFNMATETVTLYSSNTISASSYFVVAGTKFIGRPFLYADSGTTAYFLSAIPYSTDDAYYFSFYTNYLAASPTVSLGDVEFEAHNGSTSSPFYTTTGNAKSAWGHATYHFIDPENGVTNNTARIYRFISRDGNGFRYGSPQTSSTTIIDYTTTTVPNINDAYHTTSYVNWDSTTHSDGYIYLAYEQIGSTKNLVISILDPTDLSIVASNVFDEFTGVDFGQANQGIIRGINVDGNGKIHITARGDSKKYYATFVFDSTDARIYKEQDVTVQLDGVFQNIVSMPSKTNNYLFTYYNHGFSWGSNVYRYDYLKVYGAGSGYVSNITDTNIIGFAKEEAANGDQLTVVTKGGILPTTDLTVNTDYYINNNGELTTTFTSGRFMGRSLSTTDLLVDVAYGEKKGAVSPNRNITTDYVGNVTFPDADQIKFGTGADAQVYHNGSSFYINNTTGNTYLLGDSNTYIQGSTITLETNGGEDALYYNGATLYGYYNGTEKWRTDSGGMVVQGYVYATTGIAHSGDTNNRMYFGTDTQTYQTGGLTRMYIDNTGLVRMYGNTIVDDELIAGSYNESYAAVTSTTNATTVDCHNGNSFSHTLTENTTFTFSNPPANNTAYSMSLEIIQDASASGFTVTWPASVDWPNATAPTLTATASAKDVFVFTTRDGGTTWYGFTAGQALA